MGEMSVMNQQEYEKLCKEHGLKRELGMTTFFTELYVGTISPGFTVNNAMSNLSLL